MYHLDLYRIEGGANEVHSLGLDEMLGEDAVVVVVEWPERLGAFTIPNAYQVVIDDLGGDERSVSVRHDF
jgi:tRNA A37 threonylcarbamoyladenosine biosynthesis protein TsaE